VLADKSLLLRLKPERLLLIPWVSKRLTWPQEDCLEELALPFTISSGPQGRKDWFRLVAGGYAGLFGPINGILGWTPPLRQPVNPLFAVR